MKLDVDLDALTYYPPQDSELDANSTGGRERRDIYPERNTPTPGVKRPLCPSDEDVLSRMVRSYEAEGQDLRR